MFHPNRSLEILDTTLRDGNYVVDFSFTAQDVAFLASELERCGIDWIEIGHGLGLGASRKYGQAGSSDVDYIKAARNALKNSKFGVFAIPGIASQDDIKMAADLGMDFIRIGANIDRVNEMEKLVNFSRKAGLFVCTNFMKSYCMEPFDFAKLGRQAEDFGSQMNYVVDSAGGMLPNEVKEYIYALHEVTNVPVGFHGHDNTRMAVANSLAAAESGVSLVDTTLFGIGRGSGNAATEVMAYAFKKLFDWFPEKKVKRLVRLAESFSLPLVGGAPDALLSTSLGMSQVHSMYLEVILAHAKEESVDPHMLISQVGEIDKMHVDERVLKQAVDQVLRSVDSHSTEVN